MVGSEVYYEPLKVGDTAFTPVTDHPDFPKCFYVGESALFRAREAAERIADAWNSYGGDWKWYVKEVTLLSRMEEPKGEQLSLW